MSSITFFGAAGSVTGSKHLVSIADKNILLDCGMFQGLPDVRNRNRAFPFDPDSIDAVVLSHAHLDHCGMLPLLVKRDIKGVFLQLEQHKRLHYIYSKIPQELKSRMLCIKESTILVPLMKESFYLPGTMLRQQ